MYVEFGGLKLRISMFFRIKLVTFMGYLNELNHC